MSRSIADDRIIDRDPSKIEMILVIFLDERIRNIWDIKPGIGFSSHVNLVIVRIEGLNELLPETFELLRKLKFVADVWRSLSKADTNRLLDINHVGEVSPAVRVFDRPKSSRHPGEGAIFGKKPTERTATRASIQPTSVWLDQCPVRNLCGILTR